ncbi:MAG: alpha/beta hydrolase [Nocardioides sp.]
MRRWLVGLLVLGLVGVTAGVGVTMALLGTHADRPSTGAGVPRVSPSPAGPEATRAPRPALAPYYGQRLDWQPCGDFYCARLTVPLDYADPGGETISLALLMRPASVPGERQGYLVVNPGGPGGPGTDYARGATTYFRRQLTDRFDVVGFDPRGTGDSSPVDCLTDDQLDRWISLDRTPETPAQERELQAAFDRFGAGCVQRSGALASHISTVEAARDIDVLRGALGERTLTYFGASYGTKLGATYAELFPDRAGRLVLDGALDPTLGVVALTRQQAGGFETALRAYVANCVDSTDSCFLGDSVDGGVARIEGLLGDLERRPLPAGGSHQLVGRGVLRDRDASVQRRLLVPAVQRPQGRLRRRRSHAAGPRRRVLLPQRRRQLRQQLRGGLPGHHLPGRPGSVTPARVERLLPGFERSSPTFGEVFAWDSVGCAGFPARAEEQPPTIDAPGAPPILVIGTTRDPATPLAWARALAAQLDSGVLVTRDGDGTLATTPATRAWTVPSSHTCSTAPSRRTASPAEEGAGGPPAGGGYQPEGVGT